MSEDKVTGSEESPGATTGELERRLEDFTRRALVKAGWTAPIVLAVSLPAHAQHSPHDDAHSDAHGDTHGDSHGDSHNDVVPHDDAHVDAHDDAHNDAHNDVHNDVHDDVHNDVHNDVHDDVHSDVHNDVHSDVHEDVHVDVHDDSPCDTVGQLTCGGITFTASAVMTSFESKCQDSQQWTECCDADETVRFEEPCSAELTLSHNHSVNLNIKVEYFTFQSTNCTNQSSFAEYQNVPPNTPTAITGSVQGDSPECTGFRIVEVKETVSGTEITACKPENCPEGDLGIYAILLPNGASCP